MSAEPVEAIRLDPAEEQLLLLLTVRLGASYLCTGLREGRADL
ncbi:hypothetical protein ACFVT9_29250 [Kitasatospora cineracea]